MAQNKVKFGLKNVHWALVTENSDGTLSFGKPVPWRGAVSLTLEPQGDPVEFYADNGIYYEEGTNNGYSGTLEVAEIPDEFREEVLGEERVNGVQYERADVQTRKFALLYQFEGDVRATRHVNYYCSASRPTISSTTKTNATEVQPTTLNFTSRPRPDNAFVKAKATPNADIQVYNSWFSKVHEKPADVNVTGISLSPSSATLEVGAKLQLIKQIEPANASNKRVTYSSDNEAVATVDHNGLVTAVSAGTATITVTTEDGGFTDTCDITVQ